MIENIFTSIRQIFVNNSERDLYYHVKHIIKTITYGSRKDH
jgi:hypothetical protein